MNEETISHVKNHFNDVDVSIDFADPVRHNEFRGHHNAWKWATTALNLLKEHQVEASIVACAMSINTDPVNVDGLLNLAREYGCTLRFNVFRPTGRGNVNEELALDINSFNSFITHLAKNSLLTALPDPYLTAVFGINSRKACPCGFDSFRITPNGRVVPCVYFTREMKNIDIRSATFEDIIHSPPFKKIRARGPELCKGCEFIDHCRGGCASRAFLVNGSMDKPDPFCFKAHGIPKNPFEGIRWEKDTSSGTLVHENYLCTMIVRQKEMGQTP